MAITGTNGKSTTTTLIGEMIQSGGQKSFSRRQSRRAFYRRGGGGLGLGRVLEISSFQLEWIEEFRPQHRRRCSTLPKTIWTAMRPLPTTAAAKERIFAAQTGDDVAILNRDDPLVWAMRERIQARVVSFGFAEVAKAFLPTADEIVWRDSGSRRTLRARRREDSRRAQRGKHDGGRRRGEMRRGGRADGFNKPWNDFPGLEHRLEFVREKDGVRYYNDSKGTNVGAVVKSLASFSAPVILLAGGVDKGGDYGALEQEIKQKVRRLVLFGAAKKIIARALGASHRDRDRRRSPGGGARRGGACAAGRRRAAVAGLFELRPVSQLRRARQSFSKGSCNNYERRFGGRQMDAARGRRAAGDGHDHGVEHQLSLFPGTLRRRHLFFSQAIDRHGRRGDRADCLFDGAVARFIAALLIRFWPSAFIILALVLIPGIGVSRGGARRWLMLPGFAFQPSELAKLAIVFYLAHSMAKKEAVDSHVFRRRLAASASSAGLFAADAFARTGFRHRVDPDDAALFHALHRRRARASSARHRADGVAGVGLRDDESGVPVAPLDELS